MYLETADTIEEVVTYGIKPLVEFLDIFEEEALEDMEPGSKEQILWIEIKAKTYQIREAAKRINKIDAARNQTALTDKSVGLKN